MLTTCDEVGKEGELVMRWHVWFFAPRICDEDGMAGIVHEVTGVIFRGSLHKNHTILLHSAHKIYTTFV